MLIKLPWVLIMKIVNLILKDNVLDVKIFKLQYVSRDIILVKQVGM